MRERNRSEQEEPRAQHERTPRAASDRERAPVDRERTARVRVPKIQYRFLKELDQTGVTGEARVGALSMADKIKRYPLEPQHVMASWERFTKKAIEEFKAGRGDNAQRDRQHVSYAVLFAAIRDAHPIQHAGELKQCIEVFCARRHPNIDRERPSDIRALVEWRLSESLALAVGPWTAVGFEGAPDVHVGLLLSGAWITTGPAP